MIGIIDYGMGNLRSVQKSFEFIGYDCIISDDSNILDRCSHLVLPGVGAFGDAMKFLCESKLDVYIKYAVNKGVPFLGICLGMQMLFDSSSEEGYHKGMGILKGEIEKFDINLKIPHIGWNEVDFKQDSNLYKDILDKNFYFVHSYHLNADNPFVNGVTDYGVKFGASVESKNIFGVQFHPEKSGDTGLKMLKNFGEIK